ncbi:MAG: class I SAM-dependent methyltransferase [Candidatus Omnitrophica bacterium]|nr:class I SAM-dependent methyltransferase [Candidatus Omnitrophota bacterium]
MQKILQLCELARTIGINKLVSINLIHKDILKYARGHMMFYCISVLSNLGFFEELLKRERIDVALYAKEKGLDGKLLQSVCNYLYLVHIFDKEKERDVYSIGFKGRGIFRSRGVFDLVCAYDPLFQELEELLNKKKVYGTDVFRREKFVAKGTAELGCYVSFPIVKDIIKRYRFKKVLDLGCGSGDFLFSLCDGNNDIVCYGIDISEEAIRHGRERVGSAGKGDKVELAVCNIFNLDDIMARWYDIDVLTSMYVLHEFLSEGKEKVVELLRGIRKNFPGKHIIISEVCRKSIESLRKNPTAVAEHHLFHALSNQGIITFEEWEELFKESGYKLIEMKRFDFAEQGYFVLK